MVSNPHFGCMPTIDINYDLVEVLPKGTYFSISRRAFVRDAVSHGDIGVRTPRAYVNFNSDAPPYPTE